MTVGFRPPEAARRHHHRALLRRSLRPADRLPAGGCRPPSPSRSAAARPTSPSARRGWASGPASSPASATSRWGAIVKEQMAREGVALDGIATDPARLTSLVLLVGRERQDLSADLLPRQLRRLRPLRRRHRRGLRRVLGLRAGHRHAFRHAPHRCRAAQGDADRQGRWRAR